MEAMAEPTGDPLTLTLQKLYVDLLHKYCVISLLDCPIKVFDQLCFQEIEAVHKNPDQLRKQILSCGFLKHQATTLMKILTKTHYKELRRVEAAVKNGTRDVYNPNYKEWRRVEAAVKNGIQNVHEDQPKSKLEVFVGYAFEGIALELKLEAEEAMHFLPVIRYNNGVDGEHNFASSSSKKEFDPISSPAPETLHQQLFYALVEFDHKEKLQEFLARKEAKEREVWMEVEGVTVLHYAAQNSSENAGWAVEFIRTVMKFIDENEDFPWTAQEFLNYQRKDGCTALHLAILFGSVRAVECLIDLGADIFISNKRGDTPQDLMYSMMPAALLYLLSRTGVSCHGNPQDKGLVIKLDFGAFVDRLNHKEAENLKERNNMSNQNLKETLLNGAQYVTVPTDSSGSNQTNNNNDDESSSDLSPEMHNLAKATYRYSKSTAPQLLSHVVVKIFLDLKWIKLKWPIYFLTLFYIAVYVSYTAFAVYVFVIKVPYARDKNVSAVGNATNPIETWNEKEIEIHPVATVMLACAMLLYVGLEIWQYFLIWSVAKYSGLKALLFYLHDFENLLQLLFMIGAFSVAGVVYAGQPASQDWSYWFAAFSVVVAWMLILLQLGNFYGLGQYVYMFQTVFKRFATVMALYLCFLIGFTIAFSIIFPEDKFVSFPRSFFRTFAMMTGELNFDDVFDPEASRPFEFAALAIYLGFTIIVTIVIVNLLVGLTVGDVAKIFKEADAIHREIQVDRLYTLEQMLYRLSKDIFVVPRKSRMYGAVVDAEIGQFTRDLRQELRCLLADPERYKTEYLHLG